MGKINLETYLRRYPKCCDPRGYHCFAIMEYGRCYCLDKASFNGRPCPFFKDKNEQRKERIKCDGIDLFKYFIEERVYIDYANDKKETLVIPQIKEVIHNR